MLNVTPNDSVVLTIFTRLIAGNPRNMRKHKIVNSKLQARNLNIKTNREIFFNCQINLLTANSLDNQIVSECNNSVTFNTSWFIPG